MEFLNGLSVGAIVVICVVPLAAILLLACVGGIIESLNEARELRLRERELEELMKDD